MKLALKKKSIKQLSEASFRIEDKNTANIAGGVDKGVNANLSWTVITSQISDCHVQDVK